MSSSLADPVLGHCPGKVGNKKNEKATLDREWNQILGVIHKRKVGGEGS